MSSYLLKTPTERVSYLRRKASEPGNRIAATHATGSPDRR